MSYQEPLKHFKSTIREINLEDVKYPSAISLPFLKNEGGNSNALFAIEVLMNIPKGYSDVLKSYWGDCLNNMLEWVKKAQKLPCDFLALKFNIENDNEIDKACDLLKKILAIVKKPLIITGSNKKTIDKYLLPKLAQVVDKPCIFGVAEQETYLELAKISAKKGHMIIARTPIDINLAKELNILLTEAGISQDKIIIDTNIGALGYGLDYGYSIIERVKLAGLDGDEMLNMPVIAFVGEEVWKSKETKSSDYIDDYGLLEERAIAWESTTAASIMLAGANILVLWHPDVILGLKQFIGDK